MTEITPTPPSRLPKGRSGRVVEVALSIGALIVFAILWFYVAAAAFTDGSLPDDTWAWLSSLDTLAAVVAWLALLPLAVFLWSLQADLEPWMMGLVMLGLLALSGLRRRRSSQHG
jgi:MYXO-CTERM domain-containing protein